MTVVLTAAVYQLHNSGAIPPGSVNEYQRKLESKRAYHATLTSSVSLVLQLRLVSSWGRSAPLYGFTRLAMNFTTLCNKKAQLSPTAHATYLHKRCAISSGQVYCTKMFHRLVQRTYILVDKGGDYRWRQNTGNCCHSATETHQFTYTRTYDTDLYHDSASSRHCTYTYRNMTCR